jgi:hypothetical protein
MKTKISKAVIFPLLCGALWFCTGCNEQIADAEEPTIVTAPQAAPPVLEAEDSFISTNLAPPVASGTNAVKVVKPAEVPDTVKISPALEELAKLVQAGVAEEVILAYITNSTQPFNLGSDQIVYLNDLGISNTLLTAAIQHDSLPEIAAKKHIATPQPAPAEAAVAPTQTNGLSSGQHSAGNSAAGSARAIQCDAARASRDNACVLQFAGTLWQLGRRGWLRALLATDCNSREPLLAALL